MGTSHMNIIQAVLENYNEADQMINEVRHS